MNKKLIAFGITALTASILSAAPAARTVLTHNFEGKGTGINPYPPAAKVYLSMEANAEKNSKVLKVVVPADKKYTTFYQSAILKTPGPGKIVMTLDYKIAKAVEGTAFAMNMNYNYPKKGNGSAGTTRVKFDAAPEWKTFKHEFTVPANANAIQYVFSLAGAGSELLVDNIRIAYTPDALSAPAAK